MSDDPALGLELDDDSPQQGTEVSDPLIRKECVLLSLQGKGFIFFLFFQPRKRIPSPHRSHLLRPVWANQSLQ